MAHKDEIGRRGEDLVAHSLDASGWCILARNWRCREGELDIVALEGDTLVVLEVKTRTSARMGVPAEAVTPRKLARLRHLTSAWLQEYRAHHDTYFDGLRIDVVSVVLGKSDAVEVTHLKAVA